MNEDDNATVVVLQDANAVYEASLFAGVVAGSNIVFANLDADVEDRKEALRQLTYTINGRSSGRSSLFADEEVRTSPSKRKSGRTGPTTGATLIVPRRYFDRDDELLQYFAKLKGISHLVVFSGEEQPIQWST